MPPERFEAIRPRAGHRNHPMEIVMTTNLTTESPLEVIALPSGERHHILVADPDRLVIEFWVPPMIAANLAHVHEHSDERFDVLDGRLHFSLAGVARDLDFALLQRRHWRDMRVATAPRPALRAAVAAGVTLAALTGRRLPDPTLP
jgi:hypothetical protein